MSLIKGKDGLEFYWFSEDFKAIYIEHISEIILDIYGKGPFESFSETNPILRNLLYIYTEDLKSILENEVSIGFYQHIQILHEQSNQIVLDNSLSEIFPDVSAADFATYRRVLKIILEQSCDLTLVAGESLVAAKRRTFEDLELILYLGYSIFQTSNLIASQQLIEDAVEIFFSEKDLYVIDYKYSYNQILEETGKISQTHLDKSIIDKSCVDDFIQATIDCLGVSIQDIFIVLDSMHETMKVDKNEPYPCASGFDLFSLINNVALQTEVAFEVAEKVISGLILNSETKSSLEEVVYKPQLINRYLYRPILEWKVRGIDQPITIAGSINLKVCIQQLATNAISWKKYPKEWENQCFKKYVLDKAHKNDKILEDACEELLKKNQVFYDRNVTSLKTKNNRGINIENKECGEIDFLIIFNSKIYIADSKYLFAKYDFNNWKNDFSKFENNKKKNYNNTIERKKKFLSERKDLLKEHFEAHYPEKDFDFEDHEIECLFLINTPTFYMYNSSHLMLTIYGFELFLAGSCLKIEQAKDSKCSKSIKL